MTDLLFQIMCSICVCFDFISMIPTMRNEWKKGLIQTNVFVVVFPILQFIFDDLFDMILDLFNSYQRQSLSSIEILINV